MVKFDIPPFKFKLIHPFEVQDEWLRYKRQFEYLALANGVTNKTRLKNIFLAYAGPVVQEVFDSLPGTDLEERHDGDPFKVAITKLDEYFAPKQHKAYQRFLFWSLTPKKNDEPLDKFMLRATEMAGKCNFGRSKQEAQEISVIDKVIQLAPAELREKLLQRENLVLEDVTEMVNSYEAVKVQESQMTSSSQPLKLGVVNRIRNSRKGPSDQIEGCVRCSLEGHYANNTLCPTRTKSCDRCGKTGHFVDLCHCPQKCKCEAEVDRKRKSEQSRRSKKKTRSANRAEHSEGDGNVANFIEKVDVHSYTGLTTILAVNLQQLYLLITVGSDLGAMFYLLISLTSISAILVVALLLIRCTVQLVKTSKILFYTSVVLNVLVLVLNLTLQIFDQTMEKCQVLLNQPLPLSTSDVSDIPPKK